MASCEWCVDLSCCCGVVSPYLSSVSIPTPALLDGVSDPLDYDAWLYPLMQQNMCWRPIWRHVRHAVAADEEVRDDITPHTCHCSGSIQRVCAASCFVLCPCAPQWRPSAAVLWSLVAQIDRTLDAMLHRDSSTPTQATDTDTETKTETETVTVTDTDTDTDTVTSAPVANQDADASADSDVKLDDATTSTSAAATVSVPAAAAPSVPPRWLSCARLLGASALLLAYVGHAPPSTSAAPDSPDALDTLAMSSSTSTSWAHMATLHTALGTLEKLAQHIQKRHATTRVEQEHKTQQTGTSAQTEATSSTLADTAAADSDSVDSTATAALLAFALSVGVPPPASASSSTVSSTSSSGPSVDADVTMSTTPTAPEASADTDTDTDTAAASAATSTDADTDTSSVIPAMASLQTHALAYAIHTMQRVRTIMEEQTRTRTQP